MAVKLGNGKWAVKENNLLAYNDNSGQFFNKEFDFTRGSSATYVGKDGLIKTAGLQDTNLVQNGDFSQLGSEEVVNGDFATDTTWIKNGQVTIGGGVAYFNSDGTFTQIAQSISGVSGKNVKVVIEITEYTQGTLKVLFSGGAIQVLPNSVGVHTLYFNNADSDTINIARLGGVTNLKIDNVSVKQVDPNDEWILGSGWSIGDSVANVNNISANHLSQDGIVSDNNTYAITFTILNYSSGSIRLRLGNTYGGYTSGNGTYTQYIQCAGSDKFRVYSSPSGATLSISNISVQEVQVNTPRIDFSDSADGALLLEPQRTSLITYSEDFSDSSWTKNNCTITSNNSLSPNGTQNADKLDFTTSNGEIVRTTSFTSGQEYTMSFYAKTESGTLNFNYGNMNYVSVSGTATTEWQRFELTQTLPTASRYPKIQTTEIGSLLLWGFQVEQGSYATSYIPTQGSASTRIAETCNNSGSAQDFNSEEGVLYAEISALSLGASSALGLNDGSGANRVLILLQSNGDIRAFVASNGAISFDETYSNISALNNNKIAVSYKLNQFELWINGVKIFTDTNGSTPIGLNRLDFDNASGASNFYGNVKNIQVFTEALSDEELEKLTTI